MATERVVIGISGASGGALAIELLRQLRRLCEAELHVILTAEGENTLTFETGFGFADLGGLADSVYRGDMRGAPPASGSFRAMGMAVVPCSMKTLAGIASGYGDNLLLRAADVTLKERRRLVLVPRECPFGTIHLQNMAALSALGAVIVPPVPAYYNNPRSIDDVNRSVVGKIIEHLGVENDLIKEWGGQ
jgi:polyprenyl P-hydroxybenzoate/phenylacrylic acid decarboxylase-like protein